MNKTKQILNLFACVCVLTTLNSCATIFGGEISECQKTKPDKGKRELRIQYLIPDIIFWPGLLADFATGAIYQPCELRKSTSDSYYPSTAIPKETPSETRTINTENLSDQELNSQLKEALQKENFSIAEQYQKEVDKRKLAKEYQNKTLPELNKLMDDAIKAEDYKKAEEIQKLINKRK